SSSCFGGLCDGSVPTRLEKEQRLRAACERLPAGGAVVLEVAAETGNGEERILRGGASSGHLLGLFEPKDRDLRGIEDRLGWGVRRETRHRAQPQHLPGDGQEEGEGVGQALEALELARLVGAAGF